MCKTRFRSLALLAAFCVSLALDSPLIAQQAAPTVPTVTPVSRFDIFTGYSYLSPHGSVTTDAIVTNIPTTRTYSAVDDGGITSVTYFTNRYLGGSLEYADHDSGPNDGFRTITIGPVVRFPSPSGITPFVHALAGTVHIGGPNDETGGVVHDYKFGVALKVGGGLDFGTPFFNHHLGIRLLQADYVYMHADFGPQSVDGGRANINATELSSGLLFKFGNIIPPPPITYSCSINPSTVYPGDPVTVTGTATNLDPKKPATYSWSGQGVKIMGDSATAHIDTTSMTPGSYTVNGTVTQGSKPGQSATGTANFVIKPFDPPSISCSADPSAVDGGATSTITSRAVSPQNRPLTYSYTASAGSISGNAGTATLATAGAPAGAITVNCNVADDKGQTATTTTTVTVNIPIPPKLTVTPICTIKFDRPDQPPARVNNEAKACLDDLTLNIQRSPDDTVMIVGNATGPQKKMTATQLAGQRAVNTKDYLVNDTGIDASRIGARTGTKAADEVDGYIVPSGADFDSDVPGTTAVDTSIQAHGRKKIVVPDSSHHHHHHHQSTKK